MIQGRSRFVGKRQLLKVKEAWFREGGDGAWVDPGPVLFRRKRLRSRKMEKGPENAPKRKETV